MILASAFFDPIVAPTLFRPEFSHSLDPYQSFGQAGFAEAVDNLFKMLRVLIGQDFAPLIE